MPKRNAVSPAERRRVRSGLAKLKKAGIISPKVDVRSAPVNKRNRDLVSEYSGIIDGRLRTVKLSPSQVRANKEDGLKVRRDRVIIENQPGARVKRLKGDPYGFRVEHPATGGIRPIEFHGGLRGLKEYEKLAAQEQKGRNLIGFTVDGYRSRMLFNSPGQAREYFDHYLHKEKITSFTFYQVPRSDSYKWGSQKRTREKSRKRKKK